MSFIKTFVKLALCGWPLVAQFAAAQTWNPTPIPVNIDWTSIACSADGTQVAALPYDYPEGGPIYISTNSGATWAQSSAPSNLWSSIASSVDGRCLVAVGNTFPTCSVYVSTNFAATWTQQLAVPGDDATVASSADGTKFILAVLSTSSIYTSTDSGGTWTPSDAPGTYWQSVASSADGTKLLAAGYDTNLNTNVIVVSTNFGSTWNPILSSSNALFWAACSADGAELAAIDKNSTVYISTNAGVTWSSTTLTQDTNPIVYPMIASSADGQTLLASAPDGVIFISTDSGATWETSLSESTYLRTVACSADGGKLFAADVGNFGVYSAVITQPPKLHIAASNSLVVSWTIPSTKFVMQQNSDLTTTNWIDVTNRPGTNLTNLRNEVFLPLPASAAYFRLQSQ
jgi:photosystem II stability/assembly factor-like uncharacterized protein